MVSLTSESVIRFCQKVFLIPIPTPAPPPPIPGLPPTTTEVPFGAVYLGPTNTGPGAFTVPTLQLP